MSEHFQQPFVSHSGNYITHSWKLKVDLLQNLHDLPKVQRVFSLFLTKILLPQTSEESIVKFVVKMNTILFEFVRMFFKQPPGFEPWPAIMQLDDQIYNPLEGKLSATSTGDVASKVKDPIIDSAVYSAFTIDSSSETFLNRYLLINVNSILQTYIPSVLHKSVFQKLHFTSCAVSLTFFAWISFNRCTNSEKFKCL